MRNSYFFSPSLLLLLLSTPLLFPSTAASDPDSYQDFCIADPNSGAVSVNGFPCKPDGNVTANDFFSTILSVDLTTNNPIGANASFADVLSFPGLNTLGLSLVCLVVAPNGTVPPHTHPRATELVHVTEGRLLVGFVATDGRHFSKEVGAGELFVIPRGLMHYQYNFGKEKVRAVVAFNSQLPGTVLAGQSLFGSKPPVPDGVLTMSFGVDEQVVEEIRSNFG